MITTTLEAALLITSIEFGLFIVLITFFAYRGARTTEAVATAGATELVSKVSETEDTRRTALETVFRDKYQYEGDELSNVVDEFMQREKAFYNAVVGAFLGRGDSKISDLNDELTKVVAPWISITPKKMLDADSAETLVAENEKLESELGETKQVLDKMMAEYNRAFRIDENEDDAESQTSSLDDEMDELDDLDDLDDLDEIEPGEGGVSIDLGEEDAVADADLESEETATVAEDESPDDEDDELEFATDDGEVDDAVEIVSATDEQPADEAQPKPDVARRGDDEPMTADDLDELMESLEA